MNLQKYTLKPLILAILLGSMVVACSSDETSEKASPIPEPDPVVEIDSTSPKHNAGLRPTPSETGPYTSCDSAMPSINIAIENWIPSTLACKSIAILLSEGT